MAVPLHIVYITMQLLLMLVQMLLQLFSDQVIAPRLLKLEMCCSTMSRNDFMPFSNVGHICDEWHMIPGFGAAQKKLQVPQFGVSV